MFDPDNSFCIPKRKNEMKIIFFVNDARTAVNTMNASSPAKCWVNEQLCLQENSKVTEKSAASFSRIRTNQPKFCSGFFRE